METKKQTAVLGISAFYHDAAAALVIDGEIIAAAQEERFTRKKYDASFPEHAIRFVLSEVNLRLEDLSAVVFYDKPATKFDRILKTSLAFAPRGVSSFVSAMREWFGGKLFMRRIIRNGLARVNGGALAAIPQLLFSEHHLSHAASAFYPSPFEKAAILTIDGVGEWATTTIGLGEGKDISIQKEMHFPHSLGLLYAAFTYYCGFRVNSGEYKLMGLAPYGEHGSARTEKYKRLILEKLIDLKDDGSLFLNMEYFAFAAGGPMTNDVKWEQLFGVRRRPADELFKQEYMDMALAIQETTNDIVLRLAKTAKEITGAKNLVMAGGVALNCVSNFHLRDSHLFDEIWIQPAAGDAGGAVGAALAVYHVWFGKDRIKPGWDGMKGSYLGPEFTQEDAETMARREGAPYKAYVTDAELCDAVSGILAEGNVVGWFQGRMEWGPRALGDRSILADARNPEMQKKLNLKIKFREGFRPFAPSVLEEDAREYFGTTAKSPYMLFTAPVVSARRKPAAPADASVSERLHTPRSDIPSVTHLDYSARLQTVSKETNPKYWALIDAFKKKTGYGLLVNTSFNVRGEPIVMTPDEAYQCFVDTEMDYLVIGNLVFSKKEQPNSKREGAPRAFAED